MTLISGKLPLLPTAATSLILPRLIQEGIDEGSLQPVDAQLAARVLVSLAVGMLMQSLFDPQITDWQTEARQSMELLMNGIARRKE